MKTPTEGTAPPTPEQVEQTPPDSRYADFMRFDTSAQTLADIHGMLARLDEKFNGLKSTVDGVKGKVDELVNWKSKILGGAIALGAVFSIIGFGIARFSAYVTTRSPDTIQTNAPPTAAQPAALAPMVAPQAATPQPSSTSTPRPRKSN